MSATRNKQRFVERMAGLMPTLSVDRSGKLTSPIFKQLDLIASMDLVKSLGLKIPSIVVLGDESHGKSSLNGAFDWIPSPSPGSQDMHPHGHPHTPSSGRREDA